MIDTIVAAAAGAGAMVAKTPTSLTVKTGYGKPRLVGVSVLGVTITSAQIQNTSKGWDPAGVRFPNTGNGAITSAQQIWAGEHSALPSAIDLDENSVFTVTQIGAGAAVCLLQIDYGGDYQVFVDSRPQAPLQTSRVYTAAGALTAVTIGQASTLDTFEPEKDYIPIAMAIAGAFTGPQILAGISYAQTKGLVQFAPLCITNVVQGADQIAGLRAMPKFHGRVQVTLVYYSTTTDTPVVEVYFLSTR